MSIYIACEEMDFTWSRDQVTTFKQLWASGSNISEIATRLYRDDDEVAILVIDLAHKEQLPTQTDRPIFDEIVDAITNPGRRTRPKNMLENTKQVPISRLRKMYLNPKLTLKKIGEKLGMTTEEVKQAIRRERRKDPDKWPYRKVAKE